MKKIRSFTDYYAGPRKSGDKAEEVSHLAAQFANLDADGKREFARGCQMWA